jgi:TatD DNase family protein
MGRLFDSHCHLDPVAYGDDAAVDAVVARARAAGVGRMLCVGSGYGADSAGRAVAVAERHPDVWAAVGIHPHDAAAFDEAAWEAVLALAAHPRVRALGEMGLDYHYDRSPRPVQQAVLRRQVRDALRLGLPIILHDRESGGEVFDVVGEEGAFAGAGVLWHCYTGDVGLMERIVAAGGHVSLPGIVTFKNADAMRQVAVSTPLDRLLVETDSPFLAPVPHRGRKNEPAHVALVAAEVARLRGLAVDAVAEATWQNASRLFGLPLEPPAA